MACTIAGHRTSLYRAMDGRGDEPGAHPGMARSAGFRRAGGLRGASDTYRLPSAVAKALADSASPFWMAGGLVGPRCSTSISIGA
jgi:hypothetical protein